MKRLGILLALLGALAGARAQTNAPDVRRLSLMDCILISAEHNFDVQIVRYNPQIARYNLGVSYGTYDPTFSFTGEHDYTKQGPGVDANGDISLGVEQDANVFSTALSGMLPWGTLYNLGGSASDQWGTKPFPVKDLNNPTGFTTNQFTDLGGNPVTLISTNFGSLATRVPFESSSAQAGALTLVQPLLKNFWIDQARYEIYFNKREVQRFDAEFRDQVMLTITDVEKAYFNLVFAEENVLVQRKALELANQLLAENKKRVEVGALAPLDEKQAQSQAASSEADLLIAEADRDTKERLLKNLLSDDYTNEWATVLIAPTDVLLAMPQQFDLQESWRKGLAGGPQFKLQQSRLIVEQKNQKVRFQRNQLFPQVDVVGSYGYNGSGREFSGAFDQIGNQSSPFWTVGGQVTVPLGRTSARNSYKSAKAEREQSILQLKQNEQKTLIIIEDDIAKARSDFQRVSATRQARLYAEAALEAEQTKLANGKSTSFIVLQLQRDLTSARSAEILALADYNIDLAVLAYNEGSTLERRKINLPPPK